MRLPFHALLFLILPTSTALPAPESPLGPNPVLPGADPHALILGRTWWIYPTWSDSPERHAFFAFSHEDGLSGAWKRHGPLLDLADVSWIRDDGQKRHFAWAPSMLEQGGRFYLYYSVGPQHPTPSRIGVAVGDRPGGSFQDSGNPLITGDDTFEAIDPMAFTDPATRTTWLYAGGSAGAKLRVWSLREDLLHLDREIQVTTPERFTEGAFMHVRNGRYYLSYSHGNWQRSSYSVHYATSPGPTGPWTYQGSILTSDATHKGPGHHSIIQRPNSDEWFIVYHRWEQQTGDGPYRGLRQTCIDRLEYEPDGRIRPVVMTSR